MGSEQPSQPRLPEKTKTKEEICLVKSRVLFLIAE